MNKHQLIKRFFNQKEKLTVKNPEYLKQVRKYFFGFLHEDLGKQGDITTDILIDNNNPVKASIVAGAIGVVAGLEEVMEFLKSANIRCRKLKADGDKIREREVILELSGGIKDILKIERAALNVLQRMSGIATITREMVKKADGRALVCSTRKTPWGLLDKKAVTVGGGGTHRLGLHDFALIKDNHLEHAQYDIEEAVDEIKKKKLFWEIEVENGKEAIWAAQFNPGAIMLDNFTASKCAEAVKSIRKRYPNIIFEASGKINEKNIHDYARAGVDIISLGFLTHSAKALDLSLEIV